ncbi:MAG: hypothetical protein MUO43_07275 [Desulfobacterales bacterium]|nr:hypothetical protein [Desulfobacterales bacterium]
MSVKGIYLLSGGSIEIDRSIFLTERDMGQKLRAPVYSILIIHEEGPVLIDAGLNPAGLTDPEHAWGPRAKVIKRSQKKTRYRAGSRNWGSRSQISKRSS